MSAIYLEHIPSSYNNHLVCRLYGGKSMENIWIEEFWMEKICTRVLRKDDTMDRIRKNIERCQIIVYIVGLINFRLIQNISNLSVHYFVGTQHSRRKFKMKFFFYLLYFSLVECCWFLLSLVCQVRLQNREKWIYTLMTILLSFLAPTFFFLYFHQGW